MFHQLGREEYSCKKYKNMLLVGQALNNPLSESNALQCQELGLFATRKQPYNFKCVDRRSTFLSLQSYVMICFSENNSFSSSFTLSNQDPF
jgi:hypothetical protein